MAFKDNLQQQNTKTQKILKKAVVVLGDLIVVKLWKDLNLEWAKERPSGLQICQQDNIISMSCLYYYFTSLLIPTHGPTKLQVFLNKLDTSFMSVQCFIGDTAWRKQKLEIAFVIYNENMEQGRRHSSTQK